MEETPAFELNHLFSGIKPGWVLLGVAADWVLTILFGGIIFPMFVDPNIRELGEEAFAAHIASIERDPSYIAISLLLGSLATAIGGYLAAQKAQQVHLKHGLWVALASGASIVVFAGDNWSTNIPLWVTILGWILLLPSGVLGGYFAKQTKSAT